MSIFSNTHVSVSVYIEQYARVCTISSNTHVSVRLRVPGQGPVVEDEGGGAEGGAGHVVAGPRHQRGRGAEGGRHRGHCRQSYRYILVQCKIYSPKLYHSLPPSVTCNCECKMLRHARRNIQSISILLGPTE